MSCVMFVVVVRIDLVCLLSEVFVVVVSVVVVACNCEALLMINKI